MQLTEVRISLCENHGSRLRAFCSLTFDNTFVVRDVKIIEGSDGLFLAMPSRKLADHCPCCGEKNHLKARFCNQCGRKLRENRGAQGVGRFRLHADIAHPISASCRSVIESEVIKAYHDELDRSQQPDYVPTRLDDFEHDSYDLDNRAADNGNAPLRPTGTALR